MKLSSDRYDTGPSGPARFQSRTYDAGVKSALVGRIGGLICDLDVPKGNKGSVTAALTELEDRELTLQPKE